METNQKTSSTTLCDFDDYTIPESDTDDIQELDPIPIPHIQTIITYDESFTRGAPHVVVPVSELKRVIDDNVKMCQICNVGELTLQVTSTVAIASKLALSCSVCNNTLASLERRLRRLIQSRNNTDRCIAKKRQRADYLRFEICYIRKKISHLKQTIKRRNIHPIMYRKQRTDDTI